MKFGRIFAEILETFSIRQTANRKRQFAVTRFQFRVAEISNFSEAFSSVQFIFVARKYNTIQEYV